MASPWASFKKQLKVSKCAQLSGLGSLGQKPFLRRFLETFFLTLLLLWASSLAHLVAEGSHLSVETLEGLYLEQWLPGFLQS